jgi:hypothetical protein
VRNLRDIIGKGKADSALAFRDRAYSKGEQVELLCDLNAIANAEGSGTRFLCLGVSDDPGVERAFPGVSRRAWAWTREVVPRLVAQVIEPQPRVSMLDIELGAAMVGVICLDDCDDQPFLFNRRASSLITPGSGWIRSGTQRRPLLRKDLLRIFEAKFSAPAASTEARVGFQGRVPREDITLPVLPLEALPSALAARRLEKMLEARQLSKAVLGRTDTHIARLVHAQVSNQAQAYQSHGTTTLRKLLLQAPQEHASADQHYQYEVRAHKLNLLISNLTDHDLVELTLLLKIPLREGISVADRIHVAAGEKPPPPGRYPLVDLSQRLATVQMEAIAVPRGATVEAFREPLRLCLREAAAGSSIAASYSLHGRGLNGAVRGTLTIFVTGG